MGMPPPQSYFKKWDRPEPNLLCPERSVIRTPLTSNLVFRRSDFCQCSSPDKLFAAQTGQLLGGSSKPIVTESINHKTNRYNG